MYWHPNTSFFLSQAALGGFGAKKSDFGIGFRFFFLSKAALEGLAGPPRALGALGGLGGGLGGPFPPISPLPPYWTLLGPIGPY